MSSRLVLAAVVVAVLPTLTAAAEPKNGGWRFEATPYLWGPGLDGDVKLGRLPTGGVEASFSDIWNVLDIALMASFEGRKDRWGFMTDAFYVKLSDTRPTPLAAYGDASVELTEQIYSGAGSFRVLDGTVALDVFAGGRVVSLDTELQLPAGVAQGRRASENRTWADALAGARAQYRLTPRWLISTTIDISGGGSKLSWQALAAAGYRFNKLVSLKFGYRFLSMDYDKDSLVYDMDMAGPFLGVGFHF